MKFVQIAGPGFSGKTTITLNLRKECGLLFNRNRLPYAKDYKILFVGPGLKRSKYKRRVGTDKISRKLEILESFILNKVVGQLPDDTVVVMDTFLPILNSPHLNDHEKIVKFCYTSESQYSKRSKKKLKREDLEEFLNRQEDQLARYRDSLLNLTVWPSDLSLSERIKDVSETIGLEGAGDPVFDFSHFYKGPVRDFV